MTRHKREVCDDHLPGGFGHLSLANLRSTPRQPRMGQHLCGIPAGKDSCKSLDLVIEEKQVRRWVAYRPDGMGGGSPIYIELSTSATSRQDRTFTLVKSSRETGSIAGRHWLMLPTSAIRHYTHTAWASAQPSQPEEPDSLAPLADGVMRLWLQHNCG